MNNMLDFEGGISCQSSGNNKKTSKSTKGSLEASSPLKKMVRFIPHIGVNPILKGDATVTKLCPWFAFNSIHTKSGAENLQGNSLG